VSSVPLSGAAGLPPDPVPDLPRLRRLLGLPELRWLLDRARRRLENGEPLDGTVVRNPATEAERAAAARLLGRPVRPGRALTVSLPAVDALLRGSGAHPAGLADAVVALTGPLTFRHEAAAAETAAWQRALAPLATVVREQPLLAAWYASLRATGAVKRLARTPAEAAPRLFELARTVAALPVSPPRPLGALAAEICGDAHALDDDRPLAILVLRAAQALTGAPDGSGAQWRRETWAAVGLLRDTLSSQVLVLGLPGDSHSATGRALTALRGAGQPAVLTLRQLVSGKPEFGDPGTVRICENPAVVEAAADSLGPACPPLVCLQGQPSAAALHLLNLLDRTGWSLRYHGDFDWGGLRIAAGLYAQLPWLPWRYGSTDYLDACSRRPRTPELVGTPALSPWDPDLASALAVEGRRIEEELVLDDLLHDLATAGDEDSRAHGSSAGS
jgi:uncharacterized protein (TIGR02679 family)